MPEKYGIEWSVLVNLVKGNIDEVKKLIIDNNNICWGELIEQAMRHKMFPMLCYEFIKDDDLFECIPPFINQYFKLAYDINKEKTRLIKEETKRIAKCFAENNVAFVATKGVVLDKNLYDNAGYRFLSDADFITLKENKKQILSNLRKLNYDVGTVDWKNNCVRKMSREEYLHYVIGNDKIPEHVITLDNDIIKYVSVGFATSFSWDKSGFEIDIKEAFKNNVMTSIDDSDVLVPTLDITHHFIYIIMHLYKHAIVEFLSRYNNDVNLVKFGDVYRYFNKYEKEITQNIYELINKYDIMKPICWVLYHTDKIFDSHILEKLGLQDFLENNKEYLYSATDENGNIRYWKGDMMNRLYLKNRKDIFTNNYKEVNND